jgi:hypothetical protein
MKSGPYSGCMVELVTKRCHRLDPMEVTESSFSLGDSLRVRCKVDYGCETSVENKGGSNTLGRLKQARVRAFHAEQLTVTTRPEAYERYDRVLLPAMRLFKVQLDYGPKQRLSCPAQDRHIRGARKIVYNFTSSPCLLFGRFILFGLFNKFCGLFLLLSMA